MADMGNSSFAPAGGAVQAIIHARFLLKTPPRYCSAGASALALKLLSWCPAPATGVPRCSQATTVGLLETDPVSTPPWYRHQIWRAATHPVLALACRHGQASSGMSAAQPSLVRFPSDPLRMLDTTFQLAVDPTSRAARRLPRDPQQIHRLLRALCDRVTLMRCTYCASCFQLMHRATCLRAYGWMAPRYTRSHQTSKKSGCDCQMTWVRRLRR
jgi:hypothetical protein